MSYSGQLRVEVQKTEPKVITPNSRLKALNISTHELGPGLTLEPCSFDEFFEFSRHYFAILFPSMPADRIGLHDPYFKELRRDFYEHQGDCLRVRHRGATTVGVFAGSLYDWQTYFLRAVSVDPTFQGQGLYQRLLKTYLNALQTAGYRQAFADVAPDNHGKIHIYNKFRFKVIGFHQDRDWGSVIRFAKDLADGKYQPRNGKEASHA